MMRAAIRILACFLFVGIYAANVLKGQDAYQLEIHTHFELLGPTQLVKYTLLLPQNISPHQQVKHMSFSPEPHRIFERNGNLYAEFRILKPKDDFQIHLDVEVLIRNQSPGSPKAYPTILSEKELQLFLQPSKYQESRHPEILALAAALQGEDPEMTIRTIHQFIQDTLVYNTEQSGDVGAIAALQQGEGDCTEYSDVFVALCRATGIPARTISGWLLEENISNPNHHWVEVWLDRQWVAIDPTASDENRLFHSGTEAAYLKLSPYRGRSGMQNQQ